MASLVLSGNTSGSVTISSPAVSGTTTLTLPTTSGTVLASGTAVTAAQGGTGASTLTANNVILGNGTSAVTFVAPSTTGNLLTSNGTTWTSAAAPSSTPTTAQVLSATAGATAGDVGTYMFAKYATGQTLITFGSTTAGSNLQPSSGGGNPLGSAQSGTCVGCVWGVWDKLMVMKVLVVIQVFF